MDLHALRDRFVDRDWETGVEGRLRIAMVGLGGWTVGHALPAVAESDYCEATALVSSDRAKAARVAETNAHLLADDVALAYDDFHAGEAADAYDAVYVATPNARHREHVAAAADLGKAVLCEKPLEATVERARGLVADAADVPLMTAYRMQTEPSVRLLRGLVRGGELGDPVAIHGHMTQPVLEQGPPDQWRLDPALAGPGASVTDLGVYPLNTARFVLDADPVAVSARAVSTHEAFADVPDEHAAFTLAFPDGVHASCTASQNAHLSGSFRVVGTAGEARLEPAFFGDERRELVVDVDGLTARFAFDTVDQMREEVDYFADRVLGGEPIGPDGEHGLRDVETVERVYDAADAGEWLAID